MILPMLQGVSLFAMVTFLAYVTTIVVPYLDRQQDTPGDASRFEWHIVVPARDEEAVIGATIRRLREDFPDVHVWVVDDDSDDATAAVVAGLAADERVHLVQRRRPHARTGKGDALNAAYRALDGWLPAGQDRRRTIVGVVDADGRLGANTLAMVAGDEVFGDPGVGGAQISVRMSNRRSRCDGPSSSRLGARFARYLVRMQDLEFVGPIAAMQLLRQRTGSVGLGGNGQFSRLSVLDELAAEHESPWHGALLEDYELGLHILLAGYQNRFVFDAEVDQEAVESVRRLVAQRTRWAQGSMQCSRLYLGPILRSPRLSSAGSLEAAYFLLTPWGQLFGVVYWPILYAVLAGHALRFPGGPLAFGAHYWFLFVVTALTGVGPFALWGMVYRRVLDPTMGRMVALALGLGYAAYLAYSYPVMLNAFWRVLTGRTGWSKTRRNAELVLSGPVSSDV